MTLRRTRPDARRTLIQLARRAAVRGWHVDLMLHPHRDMDLRLRSSRGLLIAIFHGEDVMISQSFFNKEPVNFSSLYATIVDLSDEHPQSDTALRQASSYLRRAAQNGWASVNLTRDMIEGHMTMTMYPYPEDNTEYLELRWSKDGALRRLLHGRRGDRTSITTISHHETMRRLGTAPTS